MRLKDKQDETRNHQVIEPSPVTLPVEVLQMVLFFNVTTLAILKL